MIDSPAVGVVDLRPVVTAAMQVLQLLVRLISDQFQQFRILAKEFLTKVSATFGLEGLVVAIDTLFHALEQEAGLVALKQFIPVAAPDNLDDMPARAAENAF